MTGLALSYLFVFGIIGLGAVLDKLNVLNDEGARKFIHIGVANWWLLAMVVFDTDAFWMAAIPPATFIVLNYISYRFNLVKAIERSEKSVNDLGTVYYAISLFLIALIAFYADVVRVGALAILIMGYGDGLSAVIGKAIKSPTLRPGKTLAGTTTMVVASFVVGVLLFPSLWALMLLVALFAGAVELFTPRGFDNLSVPLLVFLLGVFIV